MWIFRIVALLKMIRIARHIGLFKNGSDPIIDIHCTNCCFFCQKINSVLHSYFHYFGMHSFILIVWRTLISPTLNRIHFFE